MLNLYTAWMLSLGSLYVNRYHCLMMCCSSNAAINIIIITLVVCYIIGQILNSRHDDYISDSILITMTDRLLTADKV